MKKKKILFCVIASTILLTIFSGCSLFETTSTWKIVNYTFGRMDITPKGDADCGTFTLYHNESKSVTWTGEGENYWGLKWTSYNGSVHATEYSSLREIYFYKDY